MEKVVSHHIVILEGRPFDFYSLESGSVLCRTGNATFDQSHLSGSCKAMSLNEETEERLDECFDTLIIEYSDNTRKKEVTNRIISLHGN